MSRGGLPDRDVIKFASMVSSVIVLKDMANDERLNLFKIVHTSYLGLPPESSVSLTVLRIAVVISSSDA